MSLLLSALTRQGHQRTSTEVARARLSGTFPGQTSTLANGAVRLAGKGMTARLGPGFHFGDEGGGQLTQYHAQKCHPDVEAVLRLAEIGGPRIAVDFHGDLVEARKRMHDNGVGLH